MQKNLPANAGDVGATSVLGRSPGEGNGNPLQYSCLENPMDRGAWWAIGYGDGKGVGQDLAIKNTATNNNGWKKGRTRLCLKWGIHLGSRKTKALLLEI